MPNTDCQNKEDELKCFAFFSAQQYWKHMDIKFRIMLEYLGRQKKHAAVLFLKSCGTVIPFLFLMTDLSFHETFTIKLQFHLFIFLYFKILST